MEVLNHEISATKTKNVMILNKASYAMIPNRGNKKTGIERTITDEHPWQTVSKEVSASTHIKVLFLAGLLDVVQNLRQTMNIELPV